jgi:putative Mg2+ transporter-C (MgtC) family protein
MMWDGTVFVRLLVAILLGGAIGYEREVGGKPAGLRTHALVCLGSTLFMLVSIRSPDFFPGVGPVDPGRIAAQVVTGVGFLGAGTILRAGGSVRGLTTAASIWAVAAIGLAIGVGYYITAVFSTGLALVVLHLPDMVLGRGHVGLHSAGVRVVCKAGRDQLSLIEGAMADHKGKTAAISVSTRGEETEILYRVSLGHDEIRCLVADIAALDGVHRVNIEG